MMNEQTENIQVKVGDIFRMSWGYDQTNVDWFQVTRTTPKGVVVREISGQETEATGPMSSNVVAVKDSFVERSMWCGETNQGSSHRIKYYQGKPSFSMKGRYYCSLWDGKPTYSSWGH
jgi:hypothetical protein